MTSGDDDKYGRKSSKNENFTFFSVWRQHIVRSTSVLVNEIIDTTKKLLKSAQLTNFYDATISSISQVFLFIRENRQMAGEKFSHIQIQREDSTSVEDGEERSEIQAAETLYFTRLSARQRSSICR